MTVKHNKEKFKKFIEYAIGDNEYAHVTCMAWDAGYSQCLEGMNSRRCDECKHVGVTEDLMTWYKCKHPKLTAYIDDGYCIKVEPDFHCKYFESEG